MTTEPCSKYLVALPSTCGNGLPKVNAIANPTARAIGGDPYGLRQKIIQAMNAAFLSSMKLKSKRQKVKKGNRRFTLAFSRSQFFTFYFLLFTSFFPGSQPLAVPLRWPRRRRGNSFLSVLPDHPIRKQAECPLGY